MPFPSEEYRLLALFRYWNVINYFFPYKHLIDRPWSTVLTDFIPRFATNTSALDYQMTIAEMVVRMQDSHGSARGLQALNDHLGAFAPRSVWRPQEARSWWPSCSTPRPPTAPVSLPGT